MINEGQATMALNGLMRFQRRVAVKIIEVSAANATVADEDTEKSLILDLALALSKDCRDSLARKTKNGLEAARRRGYTGGKRPVLDDETRAAGLSISTEAVPKTLTDTRTLQCSEAEVGGCGLGKGAGPGRGDSHDTSHATR